MGGGLGELGVEGVVGELVVPESEAHEDGDVADGLDVPLVLKQLLLQVVNVLHLGLFAQGVQVYHVLLVFFLLLVELL